MHARTLERLGRNRQVWRQRDTAHRENRHMHTSTCTAHASTDAWQLPPRQRSAASQHCSSWGWLVAGGWWLVAGGVRAVAQSTSKPRELASHSALQDVEPGKWERVQLWSVAMLSLASGPEARAAAACGLWCGIDRIATGGLLTFCRTCSSSPDRSRQPPPCTWCTPCHHRLHRPRSLPPQSATFYARAQQPAAIEQTPADPGEPLKYGKLHEYTHGNTRRNAVGRLLAPLLGGGQ